MGEWKEHRLGDLGNFSGGVTSIKPDDYGFGTPFIPYTNVYRNSKVDVGQIQLMNVTENDLVRKNCLYGDIFFTAASETDDEVAMSSVLLDNIENLTFNGFCKRYRLHDFKTLLPEYARYYFRSYAFRKEVFQRVNGDIRYNISQASLREIPIVIPGIEEQTSIAAVLSSLDAKVDLLHRQNKTLEAMAETLFRQWFLEEAEEGWEEKAIEEIATRVACGPFGSSIKTDTFVSEGVPIISGQHLWGVLMEDNTFNYITREHAEKLRKAKVRRGDVIFTHAGSIGQAALIPDTSRYEEYVLSQRQFFMRCDRTKVLPLYIAMYFHTREGKHALLANTSTSGVPSIARPVSFLRSMVIPVPPIEVQKEFVRVAGSFYDKFEANKKETNTLTKIRDTLLPKLMSGEVRVEMN